MVVVERVHVVGAREERGFVESIDGMPQRTSTLAFQNEGSIVEHVLKKSEWEYWRMKRHLTFQTQIRDDCK